MGTKVDFESFERSLDRKLSKESFWELIPKGTNAAAFMKGLINQNSDEILSRLNMQIRVWD